MAKVNPIPEGYRTVTPYLVVGDGVQAIEFYKRALGATELFRMPAPGGKIAHAELKIGDSVIMLSEEFPGGALRSPQSLGGTTVNLHVYVEDCDKSFNQAVAAGAKPEMPPQDMFWGDRYGKLVDPFGHSWAIATHKEDISEEEMRKRSAEAFAQMSQTP